MVSPRGRLSLSVTVTQLVYFPLAVVGGDFSAVALHVVCIARIPAHAQCVAQDWRWHISGRTGLHLRHLPFWRLVSVLPRWPSWSGDLVVGFEVFSGLCRWF